AGRDLDTSGEIRFKDFSEARGPFTQLGTGEEILTRDTPVKRYGVGVLFPLGTGIESSVSPELETLERFVEEPAREDAAGAAEELPIAEDLPDIRGSSVERETDDFDLSMANAYQPSALGLSFVVDLPQGSALVVEATGGRYLPKFVSIGSPASEKNSD